MTMGEGPHERYVLLRPLNSGGYGTIYEAQDRDTGERVAIKKSYLLSEAEDPDDQGVPVVVLREGAVLRKLQHPNVLRLFDIYLHLGHITWWSSCVTATSANAWRNSTRKARSGWNKACSSI
jgi:serine/threonine-protein kinase